jgi:hypothetical protein
MKTTAAWSPGVAVADRPTRNVKVAVLPARMLCRAGTTCTHDLNAPDSPTARRVTSTMTSSSPLFRSLIVLDAGARTAMRAGETDSATGAGAWTGNIRLSVRPR